jgi:hypothetical protein
MPFAPLVPKYITPRKAPMVLSDLNGRSALFIENRGQFDSKRKVWLECSTDLQKLEGHAISEDFIRGTRVDFEVSKAPPGIYNYFLGKYPKTWIMFVPAYSEIVYDNFRPGIDFRKHCNGLNIEQEFALKPEANRSKVRVAYKEIDGLRAAEDGALVANISLGGLHESKPRIFRHVLRCEKPADRHFKLISRNSCISEVDSCGPPDALVIDPALMYSMFLGGNGSSPGWHEL